MDAREEALVALGGALRAAGYRFETVTPATHARVVARPSMRDARDLRGALGWSLPFAPDVVPEAILAHLRDADALETLDDGRLRARVRVSTLGEHVFVHSAYPTRDRDAVFFGPDTHRFARLLTRVRRPVERALDLGCGTGAGGIVLAGAAREVVLSDVSERALSHARVNVAIAGITHASIVRADLFDGVAGRFDVIAANPPYLVDDAHRTYRDGGDALGTALAARIVREAIPRLTRGGRLVLYTGVPIVDGRDVLCDAVVPALRAAGAHVERDEIDPDVFGEELERDVYESVERIAAIALIATMP
ncbi:methyltransferase [Sandaracinus amylolyticus]|uniref:Putative N(5)-glutamine methyltransferase PrmC n=1 Tax=Sandaracinus amylolyticus TaxID=927083 RepID=A0A0F6W788_9BACT|nr:class I SAM-dependent methyltransferase [Sandaracinus amylolyticus]AKF09275.1 putative N(5)-glutamine methyltransferase PrmC [Sandaracinus amylolyticus]